MKLKLYFDHASQPSRAVWTICKFGKLDIELHEKRVIRKDHLDPEILKLNPLKKLPFILDDGFYLSESHSIMKYIFNTRKDKFTQDLYTDNFKIRAKIDEYLDWHHTNTRRITHYISSIMYNNSKNADESFKVMEAALDAINTHFLKEDKYINGIDNISLADISCYCELAQLQLINFDLSKYDRITTWQGKVNQFEEVQETHKLFNKLAASYKAKQTKY
jgi:glutathione S-transferase